MHEESEERQNYAAYLAWIRKKTRMRREGDKKDGNDRDENGIGVAGLDGMPYTLLPISKDKLKLNKATQVNDTSRNAVGTPASTGIDVVCWRKHTAEATPGQLFLLQTELCPVGCVHVDNLFSVHPHHRRPVKRKKKNLNERKGKVFLKSIEGTSGWIYLQKNDLRPHLADQLVQDTVSHRQRIQRAEDLRQSGRYRSNKLPPIQMS